jgi:hypothetical protein
MQNINVYFFNFFSIIEVEAFEARLAVLSQISTVFAPEYSLFNVRIPPEEYLNIQSVPRRKRINSPLERRTG